MGADEIQKIADIILEPKAKTENRYILAIVILTMITTILLGIDIGKWQEWRDDMSTWRNEVKVTIQSHEAAIMTLQNEKNARKAEKNKTVQIKNGN